MNRVLCNKKLFIFDMDGTIYLGNHAFSYAVDFINALRANGKQILFFTNNASCDTSSYLERLTRMGFGASADEIMSSGDVTAAFLARERKGKSVYLVGTTELAGLFEKNGIFLVGTEEEHADIVVSSIDTSLTYDKLYHACRYIGNGAEFFCTHPDYNCPIENGFVPDSGAIAAMIALTTGKKPRYFGKPHHDTMDMICRATGFAKEDMCIFGDRLYTDIALGKKHGVTSILVMTGETNAEMLPTVNEHNRPDFIYPSLAEVMADMGLSR